MTPGTLHDFAHHVAPVLAGINHLVAEATRREFMEFGHFGVLYLSRNS
jgi:hypothetical protein